MRHRAEGCSLGVAMVNAGTASALQPARSCRGWYQAERQPGSWQYTTKCPGPCSRSACAGAQSHGIHDKITRPGPQGCPLAHFRG
jgi:hypothetical protein